MLNDYDKLVLEIKHYFLDAFTTVTDISQFVVYTSYCRLGTSARIDNGGRAHAAGALDALAALFMCFCL